MRFVNQMLFATVNAAVAGIRVVALGNVVAEMRGRFPYSSFERGMERDRCSSLSDDPRHDSKRDRRTQKHLTLGLTTGLLHCLATLLPTWQQPVRAALAISAVHCPPTRTAPPRGC
ncbi:MAG: hypothetical protein AAFN70_01720 [Planctomycetota bacterium]